MKERRTAARVAITPPLDGRLSGVPVRIVELSTTGARVEHKERFALTRPELEIAFQGTTAKLEVRIVRSQIAGSGQTGLTYSTGIEFAGDQLLAQQVLSLLLAEFAPPSPEDHPVEAQPAPAAERPAVASPAGPPPDAGQQPDTAPAQPPPAPSRREVSFEDSWTRQVKFLRDDSEDDLPYAQFHLIDDRWTKEYAATAEQPEDGFTVRRDSDEFADLQNAYACADDDTRRMMRIALQTKLEATKTG